MTSARHDDLNRRNLMNFCNALQRYVTAGGMMSITTSHGAEEDDNRIVLSIRDWEAFRAALEPEAMMGEDGPSDR